MPPLKPLSFVPRGWIPLGALSTVGVLLPVVPARHFELDALDVCDREYGVALLLRQLVVVVWYSSVIVRESTLRGSLVVGAWNTLGMVEKHSAFWSARMMTSWSSSGSGN